MKSSHLWYLITTDFAVSWSRTDPVRYNETSPRSETLILFHELTVNVHGHFNLVGPFPTFMIFDGVL